MNRSMSTFILMVDPHKRTRFYADIKPDSKVFSQDHDNIICTKDWEEPSRGIQIKKGNVVQIAIWAANRNPEYFEEPEEFKPERFLAGNKEKMHSYAFTSFGFGPRNCFGKRFATEIIMLLAANLVKELKFVQREDTGVKFLPAGPFFALHEPIVFDVEIKN